MHTDKELGWIVQLCEKIENTAAKKALFLLLSELYKNPLLEIQPAPRGPFTEIKPRFLGKKYFAFNSSKNKLRWWFTKSAFRDEIVDCKEVLQLFPEADEVNNGEIAINIKMATEARDLLKFLDRVINRNS